MNTKQRGFTLLEVLISMSLFTMIGFAVVLLMRTGVEMWVRGVQGSQQEDRTEMSLPRLEEDLRMTLVPDGRDRIPFDPKDPDPKKEPDPVPPVNRFLSGYVNYKFGEKEIPCRYISFVRDLTGMSEIDLFALRAGKNPKAESYIDGKNDDEEFKRNDHLPTGGAAEILWIWLPDENRPGVGAVYRAYRTPIGGPGTLLDPKNFEDLKKLDELVGRQAVFQDVILFDVLFWTQNTTRWQWSPGDPRIRNRVANKETLSAGRTDCGPSLTWDSTRGILVGDDDLNFHLHQTKTSLLFRADDIWPRMVRVEFALIEDDTVLTDGLGASDQDFRVESANFATGRGSMDGQLMKVGTEWIQLQGRHPYEADRFVIGTRGARGTAIVEHAAGEPVYFGRVFDMTIQIPSFRDDNN